MADQNVGNVIIGVGVKSTVEEDLKRSQQAIKNYGLAAHRELKQSGQAFNEAGQSVAKMDETVSKLTKKQEAQVSSIRRTIQANTQSKADYIELRAIQAGVLDQTSDMIAEFRRYEQLLEKQNILHQQAQQELRDMARAQREAEAAQARATKEKQDFIQALQDEVRMSQMSRKEQMEYRADQLGVRQQSQAYINTLFDTSKAYTAAEMSAKQMRQAMRLLPAQITDIATSLAGGMPLYMIAIQQGGQLRDSFGGFGNMLRGLKALINPTVLAVGGLGAAAAAAYFAYERLNAGMRQINQTMIATGNAAGVTSAQMQDMSTKVSQVVGTQRQAQEALNLIISSNQLSAESYEIAAAAAVTWSQATDSSIEDVIGQFNSLAEKPAEAFRKLDEQYNFLTVSAYQQVEALIAQGREAEASRLLIEQLADTMNERAPQMVDQLNLLTKSWGYVTLGAKTALDSFLSFFEQASVQSLYDEAFQEFFRLAELRQQYLSDPATLAAIDEEIAAVQKLLAQYNDVLVATQLSAEADKQAALQKQFLAAANEITNSSLSAQQILQAQMIKLTEQYTNALKGQNIEEATRLQLAAAFNVQAQELVNAYLESIKTTASVATSTRDVNEEIRESIENYKFETDLLAMNTYERELATFARDMENKGIRENTAAWNENMEAFIQAQMTRRSMQAQLDYLDREKEMLEESNRQRIKAEEDFAKEAERINNQIGQSLTDALVEGGVSAKEFLIKMFRTLVLRPILQPIISGVLGAMGFGSTGAALAGTPGGGGGTDFLGLAGALKSSYDVLSGGFTAIGSAASGLTASLMGAEGAAIAFMEGTGAASLEAIATLETINATAATVGAAATVLAGVAAGIGAGTFISGNFKVGGDQMISTGLGTAAGLGVAALAGLGPVGLAIGALIGGAGGGLFNRAFGMGATTTEAVGIQGAMGIDGLLAQQFTTTKQKGGWFRGDKVRTSYEALEGDLLDRLSQTAVNIGETVIAMADSLGMSAENLQGFTRGFTLDFKGMSPEDIDRRMQEEFGYFADALAETINPAIYDFQRGSETASQILTRLSGVLTTVNRSFDVLGFTLYEASITGADAAQTMIDLMGGIEQFTAATSFYYENFYSEQERANNQLMQMSDLFNAMGLALPNTNDEFRAMVESAEAAGNTTLLASLLQLAPAFHSLTTAMAQANSQILQQRNQLVGQIYQILGDTASIRAQEISELDESNRSLQEYIYAIEDASSALQTANDDVATATAELEKAVAAEIATIEETIQNQLAASLKYLSDQFEQLTTDINAQITTLQAQRQVANEALSNIRSIFDFLTDQINDIFGLIRPAQTAAEGALFVTRALEAAQRTGYLPDPDQLRSAVSAARSGLGGESFGSSFEMARANLRFANELIQLQEIAASQSVAVEEQVNAADEQIELLRRRLEQAQQQYDDQVTSTRMFYDAQLTSERNQLNALLGINGSVQSVSTAIRGLASAIDAQGAASAALLLAQQQAAQAAATATQQTTMTPTQQAIGSFYQELLGRQASLSEIQYWESTGDSLTQIRSNIERNQESVQFQIRRAYEQILGRQADAPGLAYWTNQVVSGVMTLDGVRQSLENSIRGFANGGYASPGMAIVGEEGPELVNFSRPAMVYTAGETAEILNGGAKAADTSNEIRQLRQENQAQSRALVSLQARMTKLMERWDNDGLPSERYEGVTA